LEEETGLLLFVVKQRSSVPSQFRVLVHVSPSQVKHFLPFGENLLASGRTKNKLFEEGNGNGLFSTKFLENYVSVPNKARQGKANLFIEHNSYTRQFKVLYSYIKSEEGNVVPFLFILETELVKTWSFNF